MARKVAFKTGVENCIVHFDHILNAEWLSKIQAWCIVWNAGFEQKWPGLGRFCVRMRIRLNWGHELKRLWVFTILECFHIFGKLLSFVVSVKLFWPVLMVYVFSKLLKISRTVNRCSSIAKLLNYELWTTQTVVFAPHEVPTWTKALGSNPIAVSGLPMKCLPEPKRWVRTQ